MGSEDYDDSSGKLRRQDSKTRSGLLLTALIAGVCLGVMFAERLYIHFQEAEQGGGMVPAGAGAGSGKVSRKLGQVRAVWVEGWQAGCAKILRKASKMHQPSDWHCSSRADCNTRCRADARCGA